MASIFVKYALSNNNYYYWESVTIVFELRSCYSYLHYYSYLATELSIMQCMDKVLHVGRQIIFFFFFFFLSLLFPMINKLG